MYNFDYYQFQQELNDASSVEEAESMINEASMEALAADDDAAYRAIESLRYGNWPNNPEYDGYMGEGDAPGEWREIFE